MVSRNWRVMFHDIFAFEKLHLCAECCIIVRDGERREIKEYKEKPGKPRGCWVLGMVLMAGLEPAAFLIID